MPNLETRRSELQGRRVGGGGESPGSHCILVLFLHYVLTLIMKFLEWDHFSSPPKSQTLSAFFPGK